MNQRLSLPTALLLTVPPLMWAGNAVVGRVVADLIPPMTLNFFRWVIAFAILLPFTWHVLKADSSIWRSWRRYAILGLLGVGCYNALQYLALHTSTALNVTLVGASMPMWMLATGALFFGQRIKGMQVLGALLSMAGVLVVLSRGEWALLVKVQFVPGDFFIVLASIAWAFYSWLLTQPKDAPEIRSDWAAFLMAQMVFGLVWSGLLTGGEWALTNASINWDWPLAAALLYIALGPALLAYRCWGLGVQRVGPAIAGFFSNLTPLIAALLSAAFLGELPQLYHAAAFLLIAGGIVVSSRR
ncbi:MAG: DMT family transporter [Polaromonas sp.]|nr:DMT family transporter [Polaromonas sp.]